MNMGDAYQILSITTGEQYEAFRVLRDALNRYSAAERQYHGSQSALKAALAELAEAREEIERLRAALDGDPHMLATPETRRAWRASAVRYADKLEIEVNQLRAALNGWLGWTHITPVDRYPKELRKRTEAALKGGE
jgi:DNA repair ATPase RecN